MTKISITAKNLAHALSILKPILPQSPAASITLSQIGVFTREDGTWLGATDGVAAAMIKVNNYHGHKSITPVDPLILISAKNEGAEITFLEVNGQPSAIKSINKSSVPKWRYTAYPDLWDILPSGIGKAKLKMTAKQTAGFRAVVKSAVAEKYFYDETEEGFFYRLKLFPSGDDFVSVSDIRFTGSWSGDDIPVPEHYEAVRLRTMASACEKAGGIDLLIQEQAALYASNESFHYILMPLTKDKNK